MFLERLKNIKEIYLMVDNNNLDKVLDKIKKIITIKKFDDAKTLIDTDYRLPDDITFKNIVALITYAIKNADKFYPQIFLEEVLVA